MKPDYVPTMPHTVTETCLPQVAPPTQTTNTVSARTVFVAKEEFKETPSSQLAVQLMSVAIEGLTDEELSDSGGEGMYRERDEFVVRNEDIDILKVTLGKKVLSDLVHTEHSWFHFLILQLLLHTEACVICMCPGDNESRQ